MSFISRLFLDSQASILNSQARSSFLCLIMACLMYSRTQARNMLSTVVFLSPEFAISMINSETGPIMPPGLFTSIRGWHSSDSTVRAEANTSSSGAWVVSVTSMTNSLSNGNSFRAFMVESAMLTGFISIFLICLLGVPAVFYAIWLCCNLY